jgi:hypothetical protein
MIEEQERIYQETINSLLHKIERRDELILTLRIENSQLRGRVVILEDKLNDK